MRPICSTGHHNRHVEQGNCKGINTVASSHIAAKAANKKSVPMETEPGLSMRLSPRQSASLDHVVMWKSQILTH